MVGLLETIKPVVNSEADTDQPLMTLIERYSVYARVQTEIGKTVMETTTSSYVWIYDESGPSRVIMADD